jgi:hypothetical protein
MEHPLTKLVGGMSVGLIAWSPGGCEQGRLSWPWGWYSPLWDSPASAR